MTRELKTTKLVDKLGDTWDIVLKFLIKNEDGKVIETLSRFTELVEQFVFDKSYENKTKTKQIFIHSFDEVDMRTIPWKPCERSISFGRKENAVEICVLSRVGDENVVQEQSLKLAQDKLGAWQGRLTVLNNKNAYETYKFDISKSGSVKTKTFKKVPAKEKPLHEEKKTEEKSK